jgi:peptidoglycan/LPS O-acetylase OafA/YrhL
MGTLRLYLAICVAAAHGGLARDGLPFLDSRAAVLVFFVISGFLMTLLCSERYTSGRWIAAFYTSRALRIFPLYWLVLLTVVIAWATDTVNTGINFTGGIAPLDIIAGSWANATFESRVILIFTNVTTFFQEALLQLSFDPIVGVFTTDARIPPKVSGAAIEIVGLSWTLGVELLFYLLAPFVVRSPWRIAALAVACLLFRFTPPTGLTGFAAVLANFGAFTKLLPFFLFGACLFHISRGWSVVTVAAALISSAHVALYCVTLLGWQTAPTLLAMISIPLLRNVPKWDGKLGDLSYPLYITHFIVMQACRQYAPADYYAAIFCTAVAGITILCAVWLDRPLRGLRHELDSYLCGVVPAYRTRSPAIQP